MTAPTLRPYQVVAEDNVRHAFGLRHRRVLLVMACCFFAALPLTFLLARPRLVGGGGH